MVLKDLIFKDVIVLICGTAAGNKSAETGLPYSKSGNSFYKTLYEIKLTNKTLTPETYKAIKKYGLGLTDLAKNASGVDKSLKASDYNIPAFKLKIKKYKPKIVCFNGKKAASKFLGLKSAAITYGKQPLLNGDSTIYFVAPSTSGSARRYWDINVWNDLSKLYRQVKKSCLQKCKK